MHSLIHIFISLGIVTSVVFQVFIINDAVVTIFAYVQDFLWSRVRVKITS